MGNIIPDCPSGFQGQPLRRRSPIYRAIALRAADCDPVIRIRWVGTSWVNKSWMTGKSFTHICPAPKSLVKIKDRITQLTVRERTPIPLEDIVGSMNATLRGWANYFHYRNSSKVLDKVRNHAEQRLRTEQLPLALAVERQKASSLCRQHTKG